MRIPSINRFELRVIHLLPQWLQEMIIKALFEKPKTTIVRDGPRPGQCRNLRLADGRKWKHAYPDYVPKYRLV